MDNRFIIFRFSKINRTFFLLLRVSFGSFSLHLVIKKGVTLKAIIEPSLWACLMELPVLIFSFRKFCANVHLLQTNTFFMQKAAHRQNVQTPDLRWKAASLIPHQLPLLYRLTIRTSMLHKLQSFCPFFPPRAFLSNINPAPFLSLYPISPRGARSRFSCLWEIHVW